jgi:HEPN domain-containing protein
MEKMYFEALIPLEDSYFLLGKDFIYKSLKCVCDKTDIEIYFPKFAKPKNPNGDHRPDFDKMPVGINWIKDRHKHYENPLFRWKSAKNGEVNEFECFYLVVRTQHKISKENAIVLKNTLYDWVRNLINWLEAITGRNFSDSGTFIEKKNPIEAYFPTNSLDLKPITISDNMTSTIHVVVDKPLKINDFKKALCKANDELPIQYLFLISALRRYGEKEYRQSVFDSATAVEIALSLLLDKKLGRISDEKKSLITQKYQQLVGLCVALKKLDVNFSSQHELQTKIGELRNKAIHEGVGITKDQAREAYATARKLLLNYFPL